MRAVKATAASAAEVVAGISETAGNMLSGLFQLGNGQLDENEAKAAWELSHQKKKKRRTPKL